MKRFVILVVAVFALALLESQADAQFYGNRGFRGGSGFNLSIGTGGFNRGGFGGYGGGFNRGFGGYGGGFGPSYGYRSYRPVYRAPVYSGYRGYGGGGFGGGYRGGFGGGCGY